MSGEPLSIFAGISRSCIRDRYAEDGKFVKEGVVLMLLGVGSSVFTAYALSLLGVFV